MSKITELQKRERALEIKEDYFNRKQELVSKINLSQLNIPQLMLIDLILNSSTQSLDIIMQDSVNGKNGSIKSVKLISY